MADTSGLQMNIQQRTHIKGGLTEIKMAKELIEKLKETNGRLVEGTTSGFTGNIQRELAVVQTKLDEARLWLQDAESKLIKHEAEMLGSGRA